MNVWPEADDTNIVNVVHIIIRTCTQRLEVSNFIVDVDINMQQ